MAAKEHTKVELIDVPILVDIHDIAVFLDEFGIFKRLKEGFLDKFIESLWGDLC